MKKLFLFLNDKYIGDLFVEEIHGEEVFSFSFSNDYLSDTNAINIDPELYKYSGRQYSSKGVFGFVEDMIPDRFGKLLLDRQEKEKAIEENKLPQKLKTSDYLVRVSDVSRMGGLQIKEKLDGNYVNNKGNPIPPYIYLRDIEYASIQLEEDNASSIIVEKLLYPGSSLGGARPKANVYYNDEVYIAKFPSKSDEHDIELFEYLTLQIAKECGINVPDIKIEKYSNFGHTLLLKRFDRENNKRIHYMSAMTSLIAKDGDSGNYSYIDLATFIQTNCSNVKKNLEELYRRMVFSYLINNADNHLRNHAFLLNCNQYELSPMFDVNPSLYVSDFALPLTDSGNNKESIIRSSAYYQLDEKNAISIYNSIYETIIESLNQLIDKYPTLSDQIKTLMSIVKNRG